MPHGPGRFVQCAIQSAPAERGAAPLGGLGYLLYLRMTEESQTGFLSLPRVKSTTHSSRPRHCFLNESAHDSSFTVGSLQAPQDNHARRKSLVLLRQLLCARVCRAAHKAGQRWGQAGASCLAPCMSRSTGSLAARALRCKSSKSTCTFRPTAQAFSDPSRTSPEPEAKRQH